MEEIELYEEVLRVKRSGSGGVLATVIASEGSTPRKAGAKMLVRDDGSTLGTVGGGAVEQRALTEASQVAAAGRPRSFTMELTEEHGLTCGGKVTLYLEPLTPVPRLLVVGKGHIARALHELGSRTGFAVTLFEAPEDESAGIRLAEELGARIEESRAAIVIACPSHQQDFIAARVALGAQADFVGVVGSKRKRKNMEAYLAASGCPQEAIAALASPVGLSIGAQTPAEIAVSILAQLIAQRRGHAE